METEAVSVAASLTKADVSSETVPEGSLQRPSIPAAAPGTSERGVPGRNLKLDSVADGGDSAPAGNTSSANPSPSSGSEPADVGLPAPNPAVTPPEPQAPLVSDEELMAALAEVQAASKAGAIPLPSLDEEQPAGAAAPKSEIQAGERASAAPAPERGAPRVHAPPPGAAHAVEGSQPVGEDCEQAPARLTARLCRRAYRATDAVLELLNRPFFWLSADARKLVGSVSLATIAVALSAWLLLPLILPNRDAVSFLAARRAAMSRGELAVRVPADVSTEHGSGGGH